MKALLEVKRCSLVPSSRGVAVENDKEKDKKECLHQIFQEKSCIIESRLANNKVYLI
jgi:hypothetical protein